MWNPARLDRAIRDYQQETGQDERRRRFAEIIEEVQPDLVSGARRFLADPADVVDAVQESILKLWRNGLLRYDAGRRQPRPRPWFRIVARNKAVELLRRRRREVHRLPEDLPLPDRRALSPEDEAAARANAQVVDRALLRLTSRYRRILLDRTGRPEVRYEDLAAEYAADPAWAGQAPPTAGSLEILYRRAKAALARELVRLGLGPDDLTGGSAGTRAAGGSDV